MEKRKIIIILAFFTCVAHAAELNGYKNAKWGASPTESTIETASTVQVPIPASTNIKSKLDTCLAEKRLRQYLELGGTKHWTFYPLPEIRIWENKDKPNQYNIAMVYKNTDPEQMSNVQEFCSDTLRNPLTGEVFPNDYFMCIMNHFVMEKFIKEAKWKSDSYYIVIPYLNKIIFMKTKVLIEIKHLTLESYMAAKEGDFQKSEAISQLIKLSPIRVSKLPANFPPPRSVPCHQ